MNEPERMRLQMGVAGLTDAEEVDELTRRLRRRLLELDVGTVEPVPGGEPPAGAKVADVVAVGTLIVTVAQSVGAISSIVTTVQAWLSGHPERRVEVDVNGNKLVIRGADSEQQERLIGAWLENVAAS